MQGIVRPRQPADAVNGGLRRELTEKLRISAARGVRSARTGELARPRDEVFDLAARAADVDVAGGDIDRAADVLGRDGHAVDRGGERGVIAAGGAGHRGRTAETHRAAERDVEGRGLGRGRIHEGADETQRAGQIGVAVERLHPEAAVVRRGRDAHTCTAEVERHVRTRQAQRVGIGQLHRAGDHRVVEADVHAVGGLLHGDVFRQRSHTGGIKRDVRDLHAEIARHRARRVERVARAQGDLLAAEGDVHPLVAVGGEEVDARDIAAQLEGGLVNIHMCRQAVGLAVCADGDAVVRGAAEEVAHHGLRVLTAVGELAEVVGVIFGFEVVLELRLVVGHGAEVRERLCERARAVEAAEAGHGHGVALHSVHLQQIPVGVDRPDHVHSRKLGVFRRAAVRAHLMLIVCARARRLEVKGEGVRAVVIGGHGRVLHRVLTDDVVAEVARILPVGILIVLLRDGHDLVAPRRAVGGDGARLAHEDRTVLEIFLLAELDEHTRADGLGEDAVTRHDAHVVHVLVIVDEADLRLRLPDGLGAVGLLIHDAGRNINVVLGALTGGIAVRPRERGARPAGAVVGIDRTGQRHCRRDRQCQQHAADDIGALAVLAARRLRGALGGHQFAVGDVRRGLVRRRLAPPWRKTEMLFAHRSHTPCGQPRRAHRRANPGFFLFSLYGKRFENASSPLSTGRNVERSQFYRQENPCIWDFAGLAVWHALWYTHTMEDVRGALAANLAELRKEENLTQAEFAARFNYSDKAVSKWERGDSLPDVVMLKTIADLYGLRVDDLLTEDGVASALAEAAGREKKRDAYLMQKMLIAAMWVTMVWVVAVVVFLYSQFSIGKMYWMAFVWAVPVSFGVAFLFSRHWKGEAVLQCVFASLFVWSMITAFYFQYLEYNIWAVFFVGVPVQIALILGAKLRRAGVHWLHR